MKYRSNPGLISIVTSGTENASDWLVTNGTVAPRGFRVLRQFRLEDGLPVWRFRFSDAIIERCVWMPDRRNETRVRYELIAATEPVHLEVEIFAAERDHHAIGRGHPPLVSAVTEHGFSVYVEGGDQPRVLGYWQEQSTTDAQWFATDDVYAGNLLSGETYRGLPDREDLWRAARTVSRVAPGKSAELVLSAEQSLNAPIQSDSLEAERGRREEVHARFTASLPSDTPVPAEVAQLVLAADQFIVDRPLASGETGTTIIAGYPWFGDWGRDTMIALPGLAIATGRVEEAGQIIRTFAQYVDQGMLPNLFPDGVTAPEYNTADATLWYFEAIRAYLAATGEADLVAAIRPVLRSIIAQHMAGTRYGIGVDPADGLLRAGAEGVQLTWMDACIGDWLVTPRRGKPVEVNALWHHALVVAAALERMPGGDPTAASKFDTAAAQVAASFPRFIAERGLYDVIDVIDEAGKPGEPGDRDETVRPNQLFAVSLAALRAGDPAVADAPLVAPPVAAAILDLIQAELLTPVGLRSLSPLDTAYDGTYGGSPYDRDAVYHQGPVWGWLIGAYVDARLFLSDDRAGIEALVDAVLQDTVRSGCIGSVAEIYDGDAPHHERGAFAQAWSVAELLRAWRRVTYK